MNRILVGNRKIFIWILFGIVFIFTLVYNIPSWTLGSLISRESQGRLKLYDTQGTFWSGSGLLVAFSARLDTSAPLILLNWKIKLGLTKFIDIQFNAGNKLIADLYINKSGINLDRVDVSLSITQVEQLFDIVKDMGISGNIKLTTDHVQIGKTMSGQFKINLDNLSSGISLINPLGSYAVELFMDTGRIAVDSNPNAVLIVNGSGTVNSLTLSARINPNNREDMLQFITILGVPKSDGSYQLKVF
ncbi:MAG: ral secretion pathway protein [Pseudomonadota bacterium]|nr:ral secretion pathway protein [Pseudomonadota bacterium]